MGVEVHRSLRDRRATIEFARVNDQQAQNRQGVAVPRVELHRPLCGRSKCGKVTAEEVGLGQHLEPELAGAVRVHRTARRSECPVEGVRSRIEPEDLFVQVDLRQGGPQIGTVGMLKDRFLEARLDFRVLARRNPLSIPELSKHPIGRADPLRRSVLNDAGHRANQDTVRVGHCGHDPVRQVVLDVEDAGDPQVTIVPLGPQILARDRVYDTYVEAKSLPRAAHRTGQQVANSQPASRLARIGSERGRGVFGTRLIDSQVGKAGQPSRDVLAEATRKRCEIGIRGGVLKWQDRDAELRIVRQAVRRLRSSPAR